MINYELCCKTRIIYGKGRHKEVGERLKKYTDRVLIVYGGGSIKKTGLYDRVVKSLNDANVSFEELRGVKANPYISKVREGIDLCRKTNIRFILAIGGGSVIDTAKGIAMGVDYEGDVWDFVKKENRVPITKAIPVSVILTIPGTASETSKNAVLTNEDTEEKIGIMSEILRPVFSILDPELCITIPKSQIAPGVYDALSHTMERYFTPTERTDVIDGLGEGVMKAILKNAPIVYDNSQDVDGWGELMVASDFSHNFWTGFGREADWSNHALEEVISGIYDIPHGTGLSITTAAWMRYVYKKHLPIFVQFAVNVMGIRGDIRNQEATALAGIEALEAFSRRMGLPLHLSEIGIGDENFERMAKYITDDGTNTIGSLEKLTWEDVMEIYKIAK